jgi:hypothetical protein
MLILCPASSCDKPSISTSLNASTSANSMKTGSGFLGGFGVKLVMDGMFPKVTGFGNLPLWPYLCLPRHIIDSSPIPNRFSLLNSLVVFLYLREPILRLALLLLWRYTPIL